VTTFRRYVAIGDSSTEGLEDPDGAGGYIGWADRLAQHIADGQDEPLEYANLAIRGLRTHDIRVGQLSDALAMRPDLLTVFAGMNDVIGPRCDFHRVRAEHVIIFGEARRAGCTVATFTMPDPAAVNPLAANLRERVDKLNAIIRSEAAARGVLVVDFEAYPVAEDPRLWFDDRLHGNTLGHTKMAAALAWRLGIAGFDESWSEPLPQVVAARTRRERLTRDVDWAVHYLAPWVGKGIRGLPARLGREPKRPIPTIVPKARERVD
jgi:lysophospholipase L1-like esterase